MVLGAVTAIVASALCAAFSAAAENSVALPGHITKRILAAAKLERLPADENVELSLVVRLDQSLLDQTLAQIYGPNTSRTKRFLSPAEFAQRFDLAQKRRKLKDFAQAAGLAVSTAEDRPNSLVIKVSGSADLVGKAFSVQLNRYRGADGQLFRAPDTEPLVPASLVPHINAVMGLSNVRGVIKPHVRRFHPVSARPITARRPSSGAASLALSGTGHGGGLAPADIKTIYGWDGTLTGAGQTVALLELDGYNPSDITLYEQTLFSAPYPGPTVTCKSADSTCGQCGANQTQPCSAMSPVNDDGMVEVALDIDMVIALAPGVSNILVYTAMDTNSGLVTAYSDIASDDLAQVVSTSWGEDEEDAGSALMNSESTIFKQMAAQGQTMFSSAGDNGAYDASGMAVSWSGSLITDDPASQPYVTGVGGTSLSGTSISPIGSSGGPAETVWNDGGGGVANFVTGSTTYWPLPLNYQSGVSTTYSNQYRNVPDVALNADPASSPYSICVGGTCNCCYNGPDPCSRNCTTLIGGTSAAAPLWSALAALVNQQRSINGEAPLGFANPSLYQLATSASYSSYFNDVKSGDNGYYYAKPGYDNASGWGSFRGDALIYALSVPPAIVPASPEFTNVSTNGITVSWSGAGQYAQSLYTAQLSTDDFNTFNISSVTYSTSATFGTGGVRPALVPATAYYFRVQASSGPNTGAFSNLGSTDTLAAMPTSLSLTQVWTSSLTLQWASGGNPGGTAYRVDYWPAAGSTVSFTTQATTAAVTDLFGGATYFLTVSALNGDGIAAASGILISTVTLPATAAIGPSGGEIMSGGDTLQVLAGAYSQDVQVTLRLPSNLSCGSSPSQNLTATNIGLEVDLNPDIEPAKPAILTMSYQNADIGFDPSRFVIARCDMASNVWVPLATSSANPGNKTLTAATNLLSTFQIMQASPPASVSQFKVGPNPLRPSRGQSHMNFLGPAGAEVHIYTLTGELVKDLSLAATGSASWDATNRAGQSVASGVYFVYVQGNGQSQTFKVIVER
jgi:kumamolisin